MTKTRTVLQQVREQLKNIGSSEFEAVASNENLQALFDQRQALKAEMNAAKKEAAARAAEPYEIELDRIERQYALYIKLSSR